MGGFVGDVLGGVTDAVGDVAGGVGDIVGGAVKTAAPYAGLIGGALGGPLGAAVGTAIGGSLVGSPQTRANMGNVLGGGLNLYGNMVGSQVSKEAIQAAQEEARRAGQQASAMAQFRPVGITTRFGSSQFQVDPVTGQLISAGYTPSATTTAYQDVLAKMTEQGLTQGQAQQELARQYLASQQGEPVTALGQKLMGSQAGQPLATLGQQYLGESPEAIRKRYVEQQTALLAPQQEQQLANIRNQLFQTGRGGLSTGATAAGGMAATNPELAAYYNAMANQQRQIAAGAEQAAQQQAQFGAGLLSQGLGLTQGQQLAGAGLYGTGLGLTQQGQQFGQQLGTGAFSPFTTGYAAQSALEKAALQPLSLSSELAQLASGAGARAGQLGLYGSLDAAKYGLRPELQYSPTASVLEALTSPTSTLGQGIGGLFGGLLGGGTPITNIGDTSAFDYAYGGGGFY